MVFDPISILSRSIMTAPTTVFSFEAVDIEGKRVALKKYAGKMLLIVNTASGCGFTPQYKGLQELHEQYGKRGLVVLGFPCNQFGSQEAGSNEEIASFCELNFGVSFPMMGKIEVNGAQASPLYQWLCEQAPGLLGSKSVKWNFTKFLVGRDGQVIKRYAPQDTPQSLAKDIEKALAD
jgi:glutathione peroxidase